MTRDEAIRRLKASEPDLKNAGVRHLYLFGSTARGEAAGVSDIDLFFDHDLGAIGLYELMDIKDLATGILGTKTDMIPRRGGGREKKERHYHMSHCRIARVISPQSRIPAGSLG